jgi:hypothetical protein
MTYLEIFTQRGDLCFQVGEFESSPKEYGFSISRSEGHNYKLLLSSNPGPGWNKEQAIGKLKAILVAIINTITKQMTDPKPDLDFFRVITGLCTEKGEPFSEKKIQEAEITLTLEDVNTIIAEVTEKSSCDTKDWEVKKVSA